MKKDFTLFDAKKASYLIVVVDWTCVRNEMKRVYIFIEFFYQNLTMPSSYCQTRNASLTDTGL